MNTPITLISHFGFWRQGYDRFSPRIIAMTRYLQEHFSLTVVVKGPIDPRDASSLKQLGLHFELIYLDPVGKLSNIECFSRLANLMAESKVKVCILEYLELAPLLSFIPPGVKTILDTHDLASEREGSFKDHGLHAAWDISWEEEVDLFKKFDSLIMIKRADLEKTAQRISRDRLIYASHPVQTQGQELREEVKNIGFIATEYPPNVDAISWFINHVWPRIKREHPKLSLCIGGNVGNVLLDCTEAEIRVPGFDEARKKINSGAWGIDIRGFVPELSAFYDDMDLIINPVRIGAGIKVKNIEALGAGLPLITTSHGARGMEEAAPEGMRIADGAEEWSEGLSSLIHCGLGRKAMGRAAHAFVERNFSPEACFDELRHHILRLEEPQMAARLS